MKVTAIFDIGRTNKKLFLFDTQYREVYKEYIHFDELEDEEGFPCDDLAAITSWIHDCLNRLIHNPAFEIQAVNFSAYGASFVHLDRYGQPATPLYNYLKPIPDEIMASFYEKYGGEATISSETASPPLRMLNSGLQLYWLKYSRKQAFRNIRWSLHLPQYFSYLLTRIPLSEYTSIGCHTYLWDYAKHDYHNWVYAENLHHILPTIVNTQTSINITYKKQRLKVGMGIHDSSAALIPYLVSNTQPFLLVSTGTWSICMNPFNQTHLTDEDLNDDCLNFLQIDGTSLKASRLFLGNEYDIQIEALRKYFQKPPEYHLFVKFDPDIHSKLIENNKKYFHFKSIHLPREQPTQNLLSCFDNYEMAYHQLMKELVELQIQAIERAMGNTKISSIYIDGGFVENEIFLRLLCFHFRDKNLYITQLPTGSAVGAALIINEEKGYQPFLSERYTAISTAH